MDIRYDSGENTARHPIAGRVLRSAFFIAVHFLFAPGASAEVADLLPNLVPLPAANIALVANSQGGTRLIFDTTTWNSGAGPLELQAGEVLTGSGKQKVHQRVYLTDGSYYDHYAGDFQWHALHNHFHFDNYALYTLQPVNAPGGSSRTGSKTTFCVMDTRPINTSLPGAPFSPVYATCGNRVQGMSVGWADTYGRSLAGQEIDFTGNADGIYQLKIEVDPNRVLLEANENDNLSCVLLNVQSSAATVLDSSGNCTAVQSISPNTARTGTSISVAITGFGFTQGMAVSFEGGNGPRPVASNVQLTSDTESVDTITATVTVPYKKQLGRNPVWDVRVGAAGVLPDAFTVTR